MIVIDKNLIVSFAEYYEIIQYDVVIIRVMIFIQPFCDNLLLSDKRKRKRENKNTTRVFKKLSQNGRTNIICLIMMISQ